MELKNCLPLIVKWNKPTFENTVPKCSLHSLKQRGTVITTDFIFFFTLYTAFVFYKCFLNDFRNKVKNPRMKLFKVYLGRILWEPQERTTEYVSQAKPESTDDKWGGSGRWHLSWLWKVTEWRRQWTMAKVVRESSRRTKCFEISIPRFELCMGARGWKVDDPQERKHWAQPVKGFRYHPIDMWISSCSPWGPRALAVEACKHGTLSDLFFESYDWLQMSGR